MFPTLSEFSIATRNFPLDVAVAVESARFLVTFSDYHSFGGEHGDQQNVDVSNPGHHPEYTNTRNSPSPELQSMDPSYIRIQVFLHEAKAWGQLLVDVKREASDKKTCQKLLLPALRGSIGRVYQTTRIGRVAQSSQGESDLYNSLLRDHYETRGSTHTYNRYTFPLPPTDTGSSPAIPSNQKSSHTHCTHRVRPSNPSLCYSLPPRCLKVGKCFRLE
jgi:hypothetical protein